MPLPEVGIRFMYVFQEVTVFSLTCHLYCEKKDKMWHWRKEMYQDSSELNYHHPSRTKQRVFSQCCGSVKEFQQNLNGFQGEDHSRSFAVDCRFVCCWANKLFPSGQMYLYDFPPCLVILSDLFSPLQMNVYVQVSTFNHSVLLLPWRCFFSFVLLCYDSLLIHGKDSGNISCLLNSHAALIDFCLDSHE